MTDAYKGYYDKIMVFLNQCFTEDIEQKAVLEAMRYSLLAGGKRLRPVLVLAFNEACGGTVEEAIPCAAAVEMIHTYSLIHDDLPCMDNDDYRRGRLTNHKVYGEATALLAGDGLLTQAFSTIATSKILRVGDAVKSLADAAGVYGMIGGQVLDLAYETQSCSADQIKNMQALKTGALLKTACELGVISANGTEEQMKAADDFAVSLGIAFQVRDDILDVIGDAKKLGKNTGADEKKNTLVKKYGVEHCRQIVEEDTARAIQALNCYENNDFLISLANELINREF